LSDFDFLSAFADFVAALVGAAAAALPFLAAAKPETATHKVRSRDKRKGDGGCGILVMQKIPLRYRTI
jgi:hypothetical protein